MLILASHFSAVLTLESYVSCLHVASTEIHTRRLSSEVVTQRLPTAHVFPGNYVCHLLTRTDIDADKAYPHVTVIPT